MHEQPQPTEEEQEEAVDRIPEEEPDRDDRAADEEPEEPTHEA